MILSSEAYEVLVKTKNFMIIKSNQADIGINFWYETKRYGVRGRARPVWKLQRQEEYYLKMMELNKRGAENKLDIL